MSRRPQKLQQIETPDEGVCLIPFALQFVGNEPVIVEGDAVASVTDAAGKFTVTFRDKFAVCYAADAQPSVTADDVDLYGQCDWTDMVANGVLVVKTKTGTSNTDPPANAFIGGWVLAKKTTRRARGR
jgi:hypothetical protein